MDIVEWIMQQESSFRVHEIRRSWSDYFPISIFQFQIPTLAGNDFIFPIVDIQ